MTATHQHGMFNAKGIIPEVKLVPEMTATHQPGMFNTKGIIPEVKLVPEAKPRDTNNQVVLFPLSILGCKHILMAQSMAESPNT